MPSRRSGGGFRPPWPVLGGAGALVAAIAVAAVLVAGGGDSRPEYPYPVQTFKDLGREHLPVGQSYGFYNSDPPTSGPHSVQAAPWGVNDDAAPKEMLVHNLEHGGVAVLYGCSAAPPLDAAQCSALRDGLAAVVQESLSGRKLVLLSPYAGMEHRIALTAWRTLDTLDEIDAARVQAFIDHYERLFNPEGF